MRFVQIELSSDAENDETDEALIGVAKMAAQQMIAQFTLLGRGNCTVKLKTWKMYGEVQQISLDEASACEEVSEVEAHEYS